MNEVPFNKYEKKTTSYDVRDYEDAPFYSQLTRLPNELALRHIRYIEANALTDDEASNYLAGIIEKRHEAEQEIVVSDQIFEKIIEGEKDDFFERLSADVFDNPSNLLGKGQTAKVKSLTVEDARGLQKEVAVKYLVTPTEKTLSASSEHDVLHEVERLETIEKLEEDGSFEYLRVPHPYFHYQDERVQCYGMERIHGCTVEQFLYDRVDHDFREQLRDAFGSISEDDIATEIEPFFKKMHAYCIHGDLNLRNFMIDTHGKIYIIDFGQSVLANDIGEKEWEAFENLKDDEIKNARTTLRYLFKKLRNDSYKIAA